MGRKKRRRGGRSWIPTAFKIARMTAFAAPAASELVKNISWEHKLSGIVVKYTGWDIVQNRWRPDQLANGWFPYLAASAITHGIQKLTALIRKL